MSGYMVGGSSGANYGGGGQGGGFVSNAPAGSRPDPSMSMVPPTSSDQQQRQHGVSFRTDLSKVGGGSKLFGAGTLNQVDEERRLIDKVFSLCDRDQTGSIDIRELEELLKLCNVNGEFIATAVNRIMTAADKDSDNFIQPHEFYDILSQKFEPGAAWKDIKSVFDKMDEKRDGLLDVDELQKISAYMGDDLDRNEVKDMIKVFSQDYQKAMQKHAAARDPSLKAPPEPSALTLKDFYDVMQVDLGGSKSGLAK
eukprot:CAMPEP_0117560696 /NCGR_PEP_ID=MMETSP0784-20121206/54008_1 /TAXON_ID=39447 /ORGANISM="" /LENGTH=253 /DNA_ID=CAMNT_0005358111 /DNA_START=92 /DNA_END=853 /DNA_ORIENTATION=-